jgi:hypothetical protein
MSTAVYGAGDASVVWAALAHTTAASFGPCRHLGPAVSQPFSVILGVFGGGTAILGVFGGVTAQKRLDPNVRLGGQVVLSFGLQPFAPLHHRLAISQHGCVVGGLETLPLPRRSFATYLLVIIVL